ncbi:MAG: isoaspartyl peptidase/L-asparaginase [Gammaproteobacteria bacterium]|nr:isoaspartyl peptidase/L-asparaginase [Gammaproteobacteria bacterium]
MSLRRLVLSLSLGIFAMSEAAAETRYALAIHGGAGTIERKAMSPELEQAYREALGQALAAGEAVLKAKGSALDAVEAAVRVMEDSPLFNAGKGAVFNAEGKNELDAAIMDGKTLAAGAVAGVHRAKNPISLARAVMEKSPHVMLVGEGAEVFAKAQGVELVEPKYFRTERRWQQLIKTRKDKGEDTSTLSEDTSTEAKARASDKTTAVEWPDDHKFGTVGAVALDAQGNLAAATSTGGMTNKKWGRVGDSPIIGAGTYADNGGCAVSATGHGEFFIRAAVAHEICAQVKYAGKSLQAAAEAVVMDQLKAMGGEGGVIALDAKGLPALVFNSAGMYRGSVVSGGEPRIAIFRD